MRMNSSRKEEKASTSFAPHQILSCLLLINKFVPCSSSDLLLKSSSVHCERQIFSTKTQKASLLCSSEIWPHSAVFRGQAGRRGTCSCRRSVPALHHNKGNLNAVLFYGHCCKILLGRCGPYETESCQIHREKAGLWIERDGLFMLATARGLLSELPFLSAVLILFSGPNCSVSLSAGGLVKSHNDTQSNRKSCVKNAFIQNATNWKSRWFDC